MKIIIIGSVAAGTSVAAKARRNSEEDEIVIYEKDTDISYSVCGLPYYFGNMNISRDQLVPRTPLWFEERYHLKIHTSHEVTEINPKEKKIVIKNLKTKETFNDTYDKLVIATGATPRMPEINGIHFPNVFPLRNVKSADAIKNFLETNEVKNAVICGAGFIGLEMIENLSARGIKCALIESANQVMPGLDSDMALYVKKYLQDKGISLFLEDSVKTIKESDNASIILTEKGVELKTDLVLISAGVIPNVELAKKAGGVLGKSGAIAVNTKMETSIPSIYAVGDCAEAFSLITGESIYRPMGSTANKMGRIAGDSMTGGNLEFRGILGTGICQLFDLSIAQTGLSQREAKQMGLDVAVIHNIKPNQTEYFPGSSEMVIKAIADKKSGKLLGAQIVGKNGVDKRIDVIATAITFGAKAEDLFHLDLAYAPPFATTKDPILYTGMILDNVINRNRKIMTPEELNVRLKHEEIIIIDVREQKDFDKGHIPTASNIPLSSIREKALSLDKNKTYLVHCNKGTSGNAAQNILINLGFKEVYNLSGGYQQYKNTLC